MKVADLFTIPCEKCGNVVVGRQFGFSEDGGWYCLYQCPSCGNLDWFALQAEEVVAMVIKASGEVLKKKGMDNGYL